MTAEIIHLPERRQPGNGAREALLEYFGRDADWPTAEFVDRLLTELWISGFKIVPLDPGDCA